MQAGILIAGAQARIGEDLGAFRGEAEAAGDVDAAVVEALGQLVEAYLDPFVFPARIAGDGREQGHGIPGELLALALEHTVLVEIAYADDPGLPVIGKDGFRGEKMETRPVHGGSEVLGRRFLPGGGGGDVRQGEEEQAEEKRQEFSEHGTFSQGIAAAVTCKSITAGGLSPGNADDTSMR